ncbi:IS701 family transposase [Nocardiopsis coralliicola]
MDYDQEDLAEISDSVLFSLPRSDQRRKGFDYLRGLLEVPGKKSIRNIAGFIGGRASDQSLHHFISGSTWDWSRVRRALSWYLAERRPVEAWVIQRMVTQKAGTHSVGVEKKFVPMAGRVVNVQESVGVWAASREWSSPINWRIQFSREWLEDGGRRTRVGIPDSLGAEAAGDRAVFSCARALRDWALPARPAVLDARACDAGRIATGLDRAGTAFIARIEGEVPLLVADSTLPGYRSAAPVAAGQIVRATQGRREPAQQAALGRSNGPPRRAAAVRVGLPRTGGHGLSARPPGDLLLLGVVDGRTGCRELWLTNMARADPSVLLELGGLLGRVARDYRDISQGVGIGDYMGRSFAGWHRHVTLSSVAHAVIALKESAEAVSAHGRARTGAAWGH